MNKRQDSQTPDCDETIKQLSQGTWMPWISV